MLASRKEIRNTQFMVNPGDRSPSSFTNILKGYVLDSQGAPINIYEGYRPSPSTRDASEKFLQYMQKAWEGLRPRMFPLNNEDLALYQYVLAVWAEAVAQWEHLSLEILPPQPESTSRFPYVKIDQTGDEIPIITGGLSHAVLDYSVPCIQLALGVPKESVYFPDQNPLWGSVTHAIDGGVMTVDRIQTGSSVVIDHVSLSTSY